ncbi:sensor domain-containing diguanylate cyclase [Zoogloea sp.]|uniref:sensor domain-containing diguanylate cyclase n=1 Tax=Zoogloea sp. TaxID=49181 RepID=UPI0026158A91|nr:sensor domain-containing diguanylate cyclase [Zoogloea sp.]MDD3354012.1 diguanylate cyclase [Zoogloea sp.]
MPRHSSWLVRMHYRMRAVSFAMLFVAACLHDLQIPARSGVWWLLTLVLVVYPHLQYRRARRAMDPHGVEMANLRLDSVLLGAALAALGFPLWITFSAFLGTLSNNTANKGWKGVVETLLAFPAGAAVGGWLWGFQLSPPENMAVVVFCMTGLTGYLVVLGHVGYTRIRQLRRTRETLRLRERDLLAANEELERRFHEIDDLHEQLREQANRDPLTGLYNRRYLDSTLERELARCKRDGHSLSVLLIDIDHFKRINDTYGHPAGDEILIRLAHLMGGMARSGDVVCRYGGEEFLLLMPAMPLEAALERAESLRQAFGGLEVPFGDFRLQASLSIGVAAYPGHGTSAESLIHHADDALYRAKRAGRNRVDT